MATPSGGIAQGLLGNPLFGMGIGLLSGAAPGGTFAGGAQAGLRNMMAMQAQNQQNKMQNLQTAALKARMAEQERVRTLQETMRAQNPAWLGNPAQAAQPAEMQPYMQSEAEMFPGEQPMGGLMDITQPAQPAQPATGLMAQNPELGGMVSQMYQADPIATSGMMAKSLMDPSRQQQFGFNQYMNAPEEVRSAYDRYKGYDQEDAAPSNVREWNHFNSLSEPEQAEYLRMKRASTWLDRGTGFYNPDAPPGAPTAMAGQPAPAEPPAVVEKDILGKEIATAEGGDFAKRLVSFPTDVRVAEDMLLDIQETQGQLARLAGLTDYSTTGVASYLNNIPGTDARAWENMKTTIQSRMALGKMMELKAASATGATGFGALSAKELDLLTGNLGKLDQASDPADIKAIILDITRQLGNKADLIQQRIESKRGWYDANRSKLSEGGVDTAPSNVIRWEDL